MLERLCSFLVVLLLMFFGEVFGQIGVSKNSSGGSFSSIYKKKAQIGDNYFLSLPSIIMANKKSKKFVGLGQPFFVSIAPLPIKSISPSLYSENLGFICKKEWQLEKLTTVPFRFRLGSLDYVNYLEQKPNAIKPLQ